MTRIFGLALSFTLLVVSAEELNLSVSPQCQLPAVWECPPQALGAVVLLHGSGAHSKEEDLGLACADKKPYLYFRELSRVLQAQGLAVLRYDKRNFVLSDASKRQGPEWQALLNDPAGAFLDDAQLALQEARRRLPNAPVGLLGHSEGAWLALQLAQRDGKVPGVGLIGCPGASLESLVWEQFVQRPRGYFEQLDQNRDGLLQPSEQGPLARQLPVLDLDGDENISLSEFQAGNLSNQLLRPIISDAWRRGEGALPTPAAIVAQFPGRLAFFQGEWDNQTPAYFVKSLEICERTTWKGGNKFFHFFQGCGHALDPRSSYDDIVFQHASEQTLEEVSRGMLQLLRP